MKPRILIAVSAVLCVGCVTPSLERYTVNQSLSLTEARYQEVMNALAVVAANRGGSLPSYALTTTGIANVTATVSMDATTSWTRAARNFAQQFLNIAGKHSPELSWTIAPVADPTLLEGAWYACRWTIDGPLQPGDPGYELLRKPTVTDIVGYGGAERTYHLGIFDESHPIPTNWVGHGPRSCVPRGACYTAHCGDTYVWVTSDHLQELADFTLVLLDIATTAPAWFQQQKQQATATVELGMPGSADQTKSTISETWAAAEAAMPDGSTKIVVQPFAEPPATANATNTFVVSHVIEKSTLSLYEPPNGYLPAPQPPGVQPKQPGAPVRTNLPPSSPVPAPAPAPFKG
jgi:hypothetical protein